jgi:hypothetical protein
MNERHDALQGKWSRLQKSGDTIVQLRDSMALKRREASIPRRVGDVHARQTGPVSAPVEPSRSQQ